ncbi:hypothetical protein CARUB_v10003179mg [Capsella rubella]|uniref:S-protein homolog n=1 Tax=Capsella rubella TaxID=81985 RepID=R0HBZ3_9BRAS|nr:S-protein homolog 21 [Capsella rubella]EOA22525.1 hypothetical protein CARUB_v10003179mg [Capsella rubella]
MGKILVCFFFLFFISIQKINSILIFRNYNIEVLNHLGGKKELKINCVSGNRETKIDFLPSNVKMSLKLTVFPKTLIWCNLWKGPDFVQYAKIDAFIGKERFIHDVCGGRKPNVCFWRAQEDGIYVRNNAAGTFKFMYKWG